MGAPQSTAPPPMAKQALSTPDITRLVISFLHTKDLLAIHLATGAVEYAHRLRLALQSNLRIAESKPKAAHRFIDNTTAFAREYIEGLTAHQL